MGYTFVAGDWMQPANDAAAVITDGLHALLVKRADGLMSCTEGSDEEAELARIASTPFRELAAGRPASLRLAHAIDLYHRRAYASAKLEVGFVHSLSTVEDVKDAGPVNALSLYGGRTFRF